jgi:hypothetical protein
MISVNTYGIPKVEKLDMIDAPIVPTPFSVPDLSEELILISEADAVVAAQERQRLRAAEQLEEEEAITLKVMRESEEMQVNVQSARLEFPILIVYERYLFLT